LKHKTIQNEVKIMIGDSLVILPELLPETVQCCVTSPPYWGLRDYDHPAQIGAEPSPELYVQNLVAIFREVRRVLRKNGTLWLNIGDGYARNGGTGKCGPNAIVGNTKKLIQKRNCKVPDCWGLKDRDLMGLPWRVAFALQEDGWVLRSRITWIKKTAMPESVKNRPTNVTEDIFLFTKSPIYYCNSLAVRQPTGANLRNYWILGPDANTKGHPVTFPRELARSKQLILEFFLNNLSKVLESKDIQRASGGAVEWARRVCELRNEDGYQILSHKDRASLKPNQYLMETTERLPAFRRGISKETHIE